MTAPPVKIDVERAEGRMTITWKDGAATAIPLAELRQRCPCAVCEGIRAAASDPSELHVITPTEKTATAEVRSVTSVGRYAIQIAWADGHDTGIYTYGFLRELGTHG